MRQLFAFRRSLRFIALALCSASIVVFVSPASARPHHGAGRHARAYHAGHHAKHHYAYRHHRHAIRVSRGDRSAPQMQAGGFADTNPSYMESSPQMVAPGGFGSPNVATEARADRIGRRGARLRQVEHTHAGSVGSRKCRRAVLPTPTPASPQRNVAADASVATGASVGPNATVTPAGGAMASQLHLIERRRRSAQVSRRQPDGTRQPVVRALREHGSAAFRLSRHRLGHGEFVRQIRPARFRPAGRRDRGDDARPPRRPCRHHHRHRCMGNPIMISGNNGNRVREAPVSRGRIYAYVMPSS